MTGEVELGPAAIVFRSYPYVGATVHPHGPVAIVDIRDADPDSAPPEIRLRSGETLFVSARRADDLRAFCAENAIAMRPRPDVWGDLLEPFLDTEFTQADDARTAARLGRFGLDGEEVTRIRAQLADAMVAYNFDSMLWDWVHLGLCDLLEAHCGNLAGERFRLPPDDFVQLYWWAMRIADLSYDQNSSQA